MPLFEFDLETFTTVNLKAPDEAAARLALGAVLNAIGQTEYAIGEARAAKAGSKSKSVGGRPADARRLIGRILELQALGLSNNRIAKQLRIHRSSLYRALEWARSVGAKSPG